MLQSQDLRVDQGKKSYIGLIQENSVQDCLSYIIKGPGPC